MAKEKVYEALNAIDYTNEAGDTSHRVVIKTTDPKDTITVLDVTELSDDDMGEMLRLYSGYREYVDMIDKTKFSFENWASHTHNKEIVPRWRSLKISGIS